MSLFDWPGKSAIGGNPEHPAIYHMLDVGAVAECLVAPLDISEELKQFFALSAAMHDLGKISESFRAMLRHGATQSNGRHWEVTEAWLYKLDQPFSKVIGDRFDRKDIRASIAGHHGRPPWREDFSAMLSAAGAQARIDAEVAFTTLLKCWPRAQLKVPEDEIRSLTWWLPGLIAVSDWLGSNTDFFPVLSPGPSPEAYLKAARLKAAQAVKTSGLDWPTPSNASVIPPDWRMRPMQEVAANVSIPDGPTLAVIEDETGSGKTEAALILAQRMLLAGKGRGLFFALPTMATANAMFARAADMVGRLYLTPPSLALAHGRAALSEKFREVTRFERDPRMPSCTTWLADDRRRALLANVGVGTIDQALLSALPVRHAMLRHFALAQKILIVDEVHEMGDPYMLEEMCHLLALHRRMGGSAILMTATLPVAQRERLCAAFGTTAPTSKAYPALIIAGHSHVSGQKTGSPRGPVAIARLPTASDAISVLRQAVQCGAVCLWVRNAVDDAVAAVDALREHGIEADLLHARFALCDRLRHEAAALATYGKARKERTGRVLVATQVVESSLDLDFDVMVSDLAPIAALVQRAGRLWRHMDRRPRPHRPVPEPILHVVSPDPDAVQDAHWLRNVLDRGAFTYPVDMQWRSARAIFDAGRIDAPKGLRALIEDGLTGGVLPPEVQQAELEREAEGFSATSLARQNLIDLNVAYRDIKGFAEDADFPTRLGLPQRTLVLARRADAGLSPWNGEAWTSTARQLSEVSTSSRKLDCLSLPNQDSPEITQIKAEWPDWMRAQMTICPVEEDGSICEGLSYAVGVGLIFS
ncbi:CRISPR-associated helicase Cas3' [Ponticoccus sp. (in: a-proteobacteria)]|uniref:CRISPR-associated helicase Cas3' n=1 Tax=Ponticoccus sp. (in: a-proteobacteria) TaxID=1925025 RepID=UPI003AB699D8